MEEIWKKYGGLHSKFLDLSEMLLYCRRGKHSFGTALASTLDVLYAFALQINEQS